MRHGRFAGALALCLAIFHTPDGQLLTVDVHHIGVLRPAERHQSQGHVVAGTNSLVYVDGKAWGIQETIEQAEYAIHNCIDGDGR